MVLFRDFMIVVFFGLLSDIAFGGIASFNAISSDLHQGVISSQQAAVYRLYSVLAPHRLPVAYRRAQVRDDVLVRHSSITMAMLSRDYALLSKTAQVEFASFFSRPVCMAVRETPHFKIHFDASGTHAAKADYIDSLAVAVEYVWQVEVEQLGYNAPPVDNAADPKYDVFIRDMSVAYNDLYYGLTRTESYSGAGYMELDNDYLETAFTTNGVAGMQVTMAHEFFHAIQFGYAPGLITQNNVWWMEICSAWMEDVVYDDINDYLQYLDAGNAWFTIPHKSLQTDDGWHEYGSCIFNHFLVKKYDHSLIRKIWEEMGSASSMFAAVQTGVQTVGTNFETLLTEFGVWNFFTGARADTSRYYEEGHLYPEIFIDSMYQYHDASGALLGNLPLQNRYTPEQYGANYIVLDNIASFKNSSILFAGAQSTDTWRVPLILCDTAGHYVSQEIFIDAQGAGVFDIADKDRWRSLYLIPVRTGLGGDGTYMYSFGFNVAQIQIATGNIDTIDRATTLAGTTYAFDGVGTRLGAISAHWHCVPETAGSFSGQDISALTFTPTDTGVVQLIASIYDTIQDTLTLVVRPTPKENNLGSAFPNPYAPQMHNGVIYFPLTLKESAYTVQVYIYTAQGQLIRVVRPGENLAMPAGEYHTSQILTAYHLYWDGTNDAGVTVAAGWYYYRLRTTGSKAQEMFSSMKVLSLIR